MVSESPTNPSIISFAMALHQPRGIPPLTAAEFTRLWYERGMPQRHPRFHQRVSADRDGYFEYDKEEEIKKSKAAGVFEAKPALPVSETSFPLIPRIDVLARLRKLATTPFDLHQSLWRVWIAPSGLDSGCIDDDPDSLDYELQQLRKKEYKKSALERSTTTQITDGPTESLIFFQGHHVLADGASMTAAFLDLCDEAESLRKEIRETVKERKEQFKARAKTIWGKLMFLLQKLWWLTFGSIRVLTHQWYLSFRSSWIDSDPWSVVRENALTLMHPSEQEAFLTDRVLSFSSVAPVKQLKWIAQQFSDEDHKLTVNDVLCACVTSALGRQLEAHRQRLASTGVKVPPQHYLHLALPVHLTGGVVLPGRSVGNNLGGYVVRVPAEDSSLSMPDRMYAVHDAMAFCKSTPMALLSHLSAKALSWVAGTILPTSFVSTLYEQAHANSICVVSNNRGLPRKIHLGGRRVESIMGFVPLPPGIPIGIVVSSYAGQTSLTVSAQPWAVPDADQFVVWMLEEYLHLAKAAKQKATQNGQ